MGLLDKVKNFFYDDEEVEEEEEIEVPVKVHHKEKKENPKEEITERELFRAERTFNFPMDVDDDTMFEVPKKRIKEEKVEINNNVDINSYNPVKPKESAYAGIRAYSRMEPKMEPKKEESKKFRPTPVISPIYGVLDKNYKKEDVIVDSIMEYNGPKKLDYDVVRQRAYGNIYKTEEPVEESTEEETKGIFFNLDEEQKEEFNSEEEVKIIYNDVTFDDEENTLKDEEKVAFKEKNEEPEEDENILSETKEQDLFNLIDNMYNSDDEEEEEE